MRVRFARIRLTNLIARPATHSCWIPVRIRAVGPWAFLPVKDLNRRPLFAQAIRLKIPVVTVRFVGVEPIRGRPARLNRAPPAHLVVWIITRSARTPDGHVRSLISDDNERF